MTSAIDILMRRWGQGAGAATAALVELADETGLAIGDLAGLIARRQVMADGVGDEPTAEQDRGAVAHLLSGLRQRASTARATGLLMAEYDLSPDVAFGVLSRVARETGREVHDVSAFLVRKDQAAERAPGERAPGERTPGARAIARQAAGVQYERYYAAPSAQVFASLIGTLGRDGRLERIEGHGTEAVFVTTRSTLQHVCLLRAWVNAWHGGTLVQVGAICRDVLTEEQDAQEIGRLLHLLGAVGDQLGTPERALPAPDTPQASPCSS